MPGNSMDDLILRHLEGRATIAESQRLTRWRQAAAENETWYLTLQQLWTATGIVHRRMQSDAPLPAEIIRQAERRSRRFTKPRHRAWLARRGVAAAALVLLGIALAQLKPGLRSNALTLGAAEYSTGAGEFVTLQLGDGSVVRLGPDSHLRLIGSPGTREVWLQGRAFFGVAKWDGQPFTVRTQLGDAKVLGTRFDIDAQQEKLEIRVVDGRVAVLAAGETVELGASGVAVVSRGSSPATETVEDIYSELDWMGRVLIFRDTPLRTVSSELEHHYGVRVEILDPDLSMRPVTAWFTDRSFSEVFTVVCRAAGVQCEIGEDTTNMVARITGPTSR